MERTVAGLAISIVGVVLGASTAGAGPAENPDVALLGTPTCYDEATQLGGSASFTVTNPANGGGDMNFTAAIAAVGSFGGILADGASTVGGFGGLTPAVYVLDVTTTDGGAASLTFVIDPCPPPTTTSTTTSTTTTTTVAATTTDPATTAPPPPTTTPPPTPPPTTTALSSILPATGVDHASTALLATSLLALGGAIVLAVGRGKTHRA